MLAVVVRELAGEAGDGVFVTDTIYLDTNILVPLLTEHDASSLDESRFGDTAAIADDLEVGVAGV